MLNLLVVDDEPNILRGIVKTLSDVFRQTLEIFSTERPAEALRIAEKTPIHILVTDMSMPGMSGGELIDRVTARYPDCKCILLTAYKDFDMIYKFSGNSGVTYVLKLEEEEVLLETVRRYAEQCPDGAADFAANIQFTKTDDGLIRSLEAYIAAHVTEELGVSQLAGMLGMHASYLSRCYKNDTGRTISSFISHVKMEKAKQLLLENRLAIHEISSLLRFEGPSYFITFFKKHGGMTPKQYRITQSPVHTQQHSTQGALSPTPERGTEKPQEVSGADSSIY